VIVDARQKADRVIQAADKNSEDEGIRTAAAPASPSFTPNNRQIPKGHDYNPDAIKPMARTLWAASIALGHVLTAYRQFARIKSSTISPDGLLGGRGYVMGVKELRDKLRTASDTLSDITDTLFDEINGPHWKPKLAQLTRNEQEDVERFVDEAKHSISDGEEDAEEEMDEIEAENDGKGKGKGKKSWIPDSLKEKGEPKERSSIPDGGDIPVEDAPVKVMTKEASAIDPWKAWVTAHDSSVPVDSTPGGPRVDSLDRGSQQGPYGSFNEGEVPSQMEWVQTDGKEDEGDPASGGMEPYYHDPMVLAVETVELMPAKRAESTVPDHLTEPTPGEALDFGLGYGARGQGLEHGPAHPTGKGVAGPSSDLPGTAPVPPSGASDSQTFDGYLSDRRGLAAALRFKVAGGLRVKTTLATYLDDASWLCPNGRVAGTSLPGDGGVNPLSRDPSTPGVGEVTEDGTTPYRRWDYTTTDVQPDDVTGRPQDKKEPSNG
jgi:gas vesicle protein